VGGAGGLLRWRGPGLLRGRLTKEEHHVPRKHVWNFVSGADGYPFHKGRVECVLCRECYVLRGGWKTLPNSDWLRDVYEM